MYATSTLIIGAIIVAGIAWGTLALTKAYIKNDNDVACAVLVALTTVSAFLTAGVF